MPKLCQFENCKNRAYYGYIGNPSERCWEHKEDRININALCACKKKSPSFQNVMILGPAPAPMYYLRGKYRYRFLIKSTKEVNIQKVIKGQH